MKEYKISGHPLLVNYLLPLVYFLFNSSISSISNYHLMIGFQNRKFQLGLQKFMFGIPYFSSGSFSIWYFFRTRTPEPFLWNFSVLNSHLSLGCEAHLWLSFIVIKLFFILNVVFRFQTLEFINFLSYPKFSKSQQTWTLEIPAKKWVPKNNSILLIQLLWSSNQIEI